MSNTEELIEFLKDQRTQHGRWLNISMEREENELILQALKAQAESEKGCRYCKVCKIAVNRNHIGAVTILGDDSTTYYDDMEETDVPLKCCPNCGRKLGSDKHDR